MTKKIYIVTGEPSGDILASRLMAALRKRLPQSQFYGVGGETMISAGFNPLFDTSQIAVMGIWEVLPRLPVILKRLRQTAADIEQIYPDALITVDSWGFVHQLLNILKKRKIDVPKIHYVAPQVWAWKRGRAKTAARLLDGLMTLLPNEPPYFEKYGLTCSFVGHPVIENTANIRFDDTSFRIKYGIPKQCTLLCMLPGSRKGEIMRLSPIFKEVLTGIARHFPNLFVLIPSVESMAESVRAAFADCGVQHCIITGQTARYQAMLTCSFAVAASGTVSLELAACSTSHIVAYKFGAISNMLANLLVRPHTPFGNLINILENEEIIPECMLDDCRTDYILPRILELMQNHKKCTRQMERAGQALQHLCPANMLPSDKAAEFVLNMLKK